MPRIVALLLIILLLSACGQKGPLFREGDESGDGRSPAGYFVLVKP